MKELFTFEEVPIMQHWVCVICILATLVQCKCQIFRNKLMRHNQGQWPKFAEFQNNSPNKRKPENLPSSHHFSGVVNLLLEKKTHFGGSVVVENQTNFWMAKCFVRLFSTAFFWGVL